MTPQKKRPAKKKSAQSAKKRSLSQLQRMVLAVAFLAIFVVAALFMLISLREKVTTVSTVPVYEEAVVADPIVDSIVDLPVVIIDRNEAIDPVPVPDPAFVPDPVPDEPLGGRPRIAIVMDDLGGSLRTLQQALDLGLSMTPSILPGEAQARASAGRLSAVGREYMIHIPMQPRSYPQTNPGADALLLSHSEEEVRRRLRHYLEQVPGAVGTNNHMGSRYTEDAERMQVVLDELKQHNLFFIDSVTISSSVAFSQARQMGLKTAARDIFLDHYEDVDYIRSQIRKLVQLAHNRRQVIAICHPYPETFEAFRLEMDWLKAQSVDFVPASHLVKIYMGR